MSDQQADPRARSVRRIVVAMVGVLVAFGSFTAITQYRETSEAHRSGVILDDAMPSVQHLSDARGDLSQLRTCIARFIRYHECDPGTIAAIRRTFGSKLDKYFALPLSRGESALQTETRVALARFDATTARVEQVFKQGADDATSLALARTVAERASGVDEALQKLVSFNAAEAQKQSAVLDASRQHWMMWTIIIDALAVGVACWTVMLIWRVLKRSLDLQQELSRSHEAEFGQLVNSVRDYGIFLLDPAGNVTSWNAGAERIFGYQANEIIGQPFSVFLPVEDRGRCPEIIKRAVEMSGVTQEGWCARKDRSLFWADSTLTPIRWPDGTLKGFIKAVRDRTPFRKAEEEHREHDVAQAANTAKDEFLASLGHELRNPLAPIAGAVELMTLRGDRRDSRELDIIRRQVALLTRLVDDLLDVSRITVGKIQIDKAPVDIRVAITRALEVVSPLVSQQRGLHTQLEVPDGLWVEADEARLVQIITNLLSNAVRYSRPNGHIVVRARRDGPDIVVEVQDDGIGIAPDLLPRVFEPFVQGPRGSDRPGGGLGLGLNIVYRLVEAHGGSIAGQSAGVGLGSTFTVRLRATSQPSAGQPAAGRTGPTLPAMGEHHILLVDDNADALLMMSQLLGMMGHDVRAAVDGPSALAAVETFKPDIAILDIGLPGMNGYELATKLRAKLGADAPRLLALSGYSQESDRLKSMEAGFEAHLSKPVDRARLLETLARVA